MKDYDLTIWVCRKHRYAITVDGYSIEDGVEPTAVLLQVAREVMDECGIKEADLEDEPIHIYESGKRDPVLVLNASELPYRDEDPKPRWEVLLDDATEGLREYFPQELADPAVLSEIRRRVEKFCPDTGNAQADYEAVRDDVEAFLEWVGQQRERE